MVSRRERKGDRAVSRLPLVERDEHEMVGAGRRADGVTATRPQEDRILPGATPGEARTAGRPEPVRIRVTPDDARTLHRSIPRLVREARGLLAASPGTPWRDLVVDLSAVPPMPIAAPLILLVNLLRRLTGDGRTDVVGVSPALAGALTAFDLREVTVTDTRGRRWTG